MPGQPPSPEEACEDAFRAIVTGRLGAFGVALDEFNTTDRESGPHKARMGLRRLTTALDAFAPIPGRKHALVLRDHAGDTARKDLLREGAALRDVGNRPVAHPQMTVKGFTRQDGGGIGKDRLGHRPGSVPVLHPAGGRDGMAMAPRCDAPAIGPRTWKTSSATPSISPRAPWGFADAAAPCLRLTGGRALIDGALHDATLTIANGRIAYLSARRPGAWWAGRWRQSSRPRGDKALI